MTTTDMMLNKIYNLLDITYEQNMIFLALLRDLMSDTSIKEKMDLCLDEFNTKRLAIKSGMFEDEVKKTS